MTRNQPKRTPPMKRPGISIRSGRIVRWYCCENAGMTKA
jgi:hypothetical protein